MSALSAKAKGTPEAPKPLWIELTPDQADALQAHFEWVRLEAKRGRMGILAAQIRDASDDANPHDTAHMRVGFIPKELADTLTGKAT
jgi:hypothetical protein